MTEAEERELIGAVVELIGDTRAGLGDPADLSIRRLEGGWSRHTYVMRSGDPERPIHVIRVKPAATLLDTDIEQEFRLHGALADHPVKLPAVFGMDPSADNPFCGPYFVMAHAFGRDYNIWNRRDREQLESTWDDGGTLASDLVDQLCAIHAVRDDRIRDLLPNYSFLSHVDHWEGIYREVELVADPVLDEVWAWLRSRVPSPVATALVHGDFRIGNTLVDGGRISVVLDWELSHWGDPRFDLGYLLQPYMAGKMFAPASKLASGVAPQEWVLEQYEQRTGLAVSPEVLTTFSGFGAAVLLVILATGAHRFAVGATDDIRLAWNRYAMVGLREDLVRAMNW